MKQRVAAVILAGGRGERLGGVIKANITVGGTRLLERVSAALYGVETMLVAIGSLSPADVAMLPGQIAIADPETDYDGPLAGLAAAVAWAASQSWPPDLLLTAAVDTPLYPEGFADAMVTAIEPGRAAVVARHGAQDYPTNAIWRLARIADLPARLAARTAPRSLRGLATELNAATLAWPDSDGGNPFANVNTPADLKELELRAEAAAALRHVGHSGLGKGGQTR